MKTGTSGRVSSIRPAETRSIDADEREHGNRNRERQHELGEVAREQRLEGIDSGHGGGCDLGALGAVEGGRPVAEPSLDELEP